ncbi:lysoplasmalogenase [Duganella sp. FT135W]|uniref:Lysoplasmalogenase n=1 Tax=Duganella flavida TaxID=2692175 RepID=A0A6L8KFF4_9BURK|nr:lysoplasmalogenase [Duganella flavida]MYM23191.1 lysoplasmalogenase [Duganella flavida]
MSWAILASALLAITGSAQGGEAIWLHYIFKPLTTMLVWAMVWRATAEGASLYRKAILAALLLSLFGDVFLMLPMQFGFELGLASFLIAHLFFLRAFTRDAPLFGRRLPLILLLALSLANLLVLWPGVGKGLQLPVVAYMLCLVAMTAQAVSRGLSLGTADGKLAAAGGIAFLISDTTLAYNKFHAPVPASALLVLGTYYAALYLIALSVRQKAATYAQ